MTGLAQELLGGKVALGLVAGRGVLEGMGHPQSHHLLLRVERELAARTTRGLLAWQCHPPHKGRSRDTPETRAGPRWALGLRTGAGREQGSSLCVSFHF